MNKIIAIVFLFNTTIAFGQTNARTYLFSEDIYAKIDRDTVAWKYQTGATELSFIGRYADVLKVREKAGAGS